MFISAGTGQSDSAILRDELFGHWQGAHSGANTSEAGLAEKADGSTLFIDEIANLDPAGQALLLTYADYTSGTSTRRVARMGIFPTGSKAKGSAEKSLKGRSMDPQTHLITVDVFLITATNSPLDDPGSLEKIGFRPDLYHRLAGMRIKLPPLRERKEDVIQLFQTSLERITREIEGTWPKTLEPDVIDMLMAYHWPGNVRDLVRAAREVAEAAKPWEKVLLRSLPTWMVSPSKPKTPPSKSREQSTLQNLFAEIESFVGSMDRTNIQGQLADIVKRLLNLCPEVLPTLLEDPVLLKEVHERAYNLHPRSLQSLITEIESFNFSSIDRADLRGQLPKLCAACAKLMSSYLKTALVATSKPADGTLQLQTAVRMLMGDEKIKGSPVPDTVKRVLGLYREIRSTLLEDPVLKEAYEKALNSRPPKQKSKKANEKQASE